jgi:glycosyltransferase involved in cell wall biosynthesis
VKLTVVGQTVQQSVLDRIRQISFVEVIQYLKKEELIEVYRNNDIYIMPSIHETFGRVYAEAMTQGLPVIYSKGQGFDGIFEDGCVGYSVPSKDADYIAQRVLAIMDVYSNISRRCIELCDMFDWNNIAER